MTRHDNWYVIWVVCFFLSVLQYLQLGQQMIMLFTKDLVWNFWSNLLLSTASLPRELPASSYSAALLQFDHWWPVDEFSEISFIPKGRWGCLHTQVTVSWPDGSNSEQPGRAGKEERCGIGSFISSISSILSEKSQSKLSQFCYGLICALSSAKEPPKTNTSIHPEKLQGEM